VVSSSVGLYQLEFRLDTLGPALLHRESSPRSALPTRLEPNADDTPSQLLHSNPLIHVNDPNGLFTSDELTRVHDAVVGPCGG
jgi:hypothetical protein